MLSIAGILSLVIDLVVSGVGQALQGRRNLGDAVDISWQAEYFLLDRLAFLLVSVIDATWALVADATKFEHRAGSGHRFVRRIILEGLILGCVSRVENRRVRRLIMHSNQGRLLLVR